MMLIEDTAIKEVKILNPKIHTDERGCFFESFKSTFNNDNGLPSTFVQDNEVWSRRGVLRGLHYQLNNPQGKLVRAVVGSILDVAVDIRLGSPTFGKFVMAELSSKNKKIFYIPEGFAHGYLVTSDESVVLYKCTNVYNAKDEYGIRWDDATIGVEWGNSNPILSERDENLPALKEQKFLPEY